MADRVGQEIGDYRLLRMLGEGTFGEVYEAEHLLLQSRVAIKLIHERLTAGEIEHFLEEARRVARLRHPHIVRLLHFSALPGAPYLVMDLAQGDLKQRFPKGKPQTIETILPYIKQAADGLQHAHDRQVAHLDIKPANLLLGEQGEVLLTDFGIGLVLQANQTHKTVQGFAGTPVYAAPEQFEQKPGYASDQYALAVVVYEWLTGGWPFEGTEWSIGSQKMTRDPPPLREKVSDIAEPIEQVVLKALAKEPRARYPSVHAFADALEAVTQSSSTILASLPLVPAPRGSSPVAAAPAPPAAARPLPPGAACALRDSASHVTPLGNETLTIGRSRECRLTLVNNQVSSRHAEIRPEGAGRYVLIDVGSTNGTTINKLKLTPHVPHPLTIDDVIEFGGVGGVEFLFGLLPA